MIDNYYKISACMCVCVSSSVVPNSLQPHGLNSLPGSSVHGIFQTREREGVATSFSRGSSGPRDRTHTAVSPALQADSSARSKPWLSSDFLCVS